MRRTRFTSALTTAFLLALFVFVNIQPVSSKPFESSKVQNAPYPYVPDVILLEVQGDVTVRSNPKLLPGQPNNTDSMSLNFILNSLGMRSVEQLFPFEQVSSNARQENSIDLTRRIYRVQLGTGTDVMGAVETLAALPDVTFAEPDYIAFPADVPASGFVPSSTYTANPLTINDPLYSQQWGLTKINIEGGWSSTVGSPTVAIAIIDSGIDLTHVDLAGNLWVNPGEIANNGLDDDSNGYIDDVNGWNFVAGNKDVFDDNGHGTLVTGVAAAIGGNGQGIVGACPQCSIMTIKVMQASGAANYSDIAAGVLYAAQKGAKVINLSLGGYANSNILKNAIDTAANTYGSVVVAGAGNDNLTTAFYPAAYDNVLAVAGTQSDDTKVSTSNYATWVDVSAPGITIRTTALGGGWVDQSGTSFSAPFASGLAGLLRTLHPDWDQATIRSQIIHTTDNINGVNPTYIGLLGSGRINAGSAMQTPHPILQVAGYSVNGLASGRPVLGTTSSLIVTLNNDWWDSPNVTGTLSTADPYVTVTNGSASFGNIPAGTSSASATAFTFSVNASAGYNHPISFNLNVADTNGYATTLNFTVTTETGVTNKSGTIPSDETWTSDQTYLITNNVGVAPGVTLTIQPGTTVKFNGNYYLNIGGTLIANGTSSQPIQFKSNTAGTWDKINFDDQSVDALADVNGSYTSGSILRYVNIEGASAGIACTTATPYLSHVTLNSGGIICSLGTTELWLLDNSIPSAATITGSGNAYRNTVSGNLSISGAGIAEDNVVHGTLSLGSGTARRNTVNGIAIGGSGGTLDTNTIAGNVSLGDSYNVSGNTITGSLTTGNGATVDHNTVSNGITVGSSATVTWNSVENSNSTGLTAGSSVTAQYNRLIGNTSGMVATSGLIEHNLIANNTGVGLQVGAAIVQYNTFTGNKGNTIVVQGDTPIGITYNNLEANTGSFDLYINIPSVVSVPSQNNWWGTTNTTTIGGRIFDYLDDFNKGQAAFAPILNGPDQTAPGYVRNVTVLPDIILGIQTGTFQVQFSKPMDTNYAPSMEFYSTKKGTWSQYNTSNSGLPNGSVYRIAFDTNGTKWFATANGAASFDGANWHVYNTSNSGLPSNFVFRIAIDNEGTKWFGTGSGVASFDGTNWHVYNISNSGLPSNFIYAITVDNEGTKWFGTSDSGAASFDGTNWHVYNTSNSGLPGNAISSIAIDNDGKKWFGTGNGVASFDGTNWHVYNTSNSGLLNNQIDTIAIDSHGTKWLGAGNGAVSFDGANWQVYNISNSGLPNNQIHSIAIDNDGVKWFGTSANSVASFDGTNWHIYNSSNSTLPNMYIVGIGIEKDNTKWFGTFGSGIAVLQGAEKYPIANNEQWLSSTTYHATYDITSAIPRDTYRIIVSDGFNPNGMRIALNSNSTFVVDYAGAISDTTPPLQPNVSASGEGGLTSLSASWNSSDPQSAITQYRYAIGTTSGARDMVGWTYTNNTSMTHNGLILTPGITYYVSAGARNEGGLWSESGISNGVVAGAVPPTMYNKSTPVNGAGSQSTSPTLNWAGSTGATSYEYCYDTSNDNACSTWTNNGASTSKALSGLTAGTTYYWQVRAKNAGGVIYANASTWWSFTTLSTTATFGDVPSTYWARQFIERLYSAGITGGCLAAPLSYCPDNTVTRAQMAVFLLKGIHGSSYTPPAVGGSTGFNDVATSYWAAGWIKQLAAEGITSGCGTNVYCPDANVSRAQMAVFLLKAKYGSAYAPPAVGGSTGFNDVATNYWAATFIKQLAAEGITSGCGTNVYCPENSATRAEMAVFLVKTFNLP